MKPRIVIPTVAPEAYQALMNLESYISKTSLIPTHKELIKIRASQINGCAFCISMHTADARKYGETEQRIYLRMARSGHLYRRRKSNFGFDRRSNFDQKSCF